MKRSYKIYNFAEDNSIITRTEQIKDYIDVKIKDIDINEEEIAESIKETIDKVIDESFKENIETNIKETITESLSGVDDQLTQINDATNSIIEKVDTQTELIENVATKDDVVNATDKINTHTTNLFNEIDFNSKFSDLNEQIKNLTINKTDDDVASVLSELTNIEKDKFKDGVESDIDYSKITIGGDTY